MDFREATIASREARRWQKHPWAQCFDWDELAELRKEFRYLKARLNQVSVWKRSAIARGLNLEDSHDRSDPADLPHPCYDCLANREKLRRILGAFCLRHSSIIFEKDLATIASIFLVCSKTDEANAYAFFTLVFDRFKLLSASMEDEVSQVVVAFSEVCPKASMAVTRSKCCNQLFKLVERWMRTILISGYNCTRQNFNRFFVLIDRVIKGPHRPSDPLHFLRHVIFCVLFSNASRILQEAEDANLEEYFKELSVHIPVNSNLLQLIDARLDCDTYALYHRWLWTPFGFLAGWNTGTYFGSLLATTVAGGGAALLAPAGAVASSLLTWRLASPAGYSVFRENANVIGIEENEEEEDEKEKDDEEEEEEEKGVESDASDQTATATRTYHPYEEELRRTLSATDDRTRRPGRVPVTQLEDDPPEGPDLAFYLGPAAREQQRAYPRW
eukprot:TRINITY_DN11852_c0_g1_i1.p1 TRINITY_DN11852_c0_g1~~TRINITY_DN11852_c0_g1_i1.p1  ORF type:complete len:444 (-),score=76.52 TRINITY_DN11852_c0_g1_i1:87-1418(-)